MNNFFLNNKRVLIICFCLYLFLFYVSNYLFLSELTDPNIFFHWYNQDQYLINYNELGFVKRGLIGYLFNLSLENYKNLTKLIVLINYMLILIFYLLIINSIQNIELKKYLILLGLSPFLFQQIGFDFGRFDHFGILYLLIIIFLVIKNRSILIFEILSPFMILVHEIHFFTVVIFLIYIQIITKRDKILIAYTIITSLIILLLLFFYGGIEKDQVELLQNKYWFINVYFVKGHIESSISLWLTDVFNFKTTIFYRHLFSILLFLTIFIFIFKKSNDKYLKFVITLFSLCFIIGIDHARFLAIFIVNIFLIYLIKFYFKKVSFQIPKFNNFFWLITLLGPWGVNICLPLITIIKKALLYGTLTFN